MSKPKRTLFILVVAVLLSGAYLWFFGAATLVALEATYLSWKMPVVRKTPTELQDQSIAQGLARKLAYFGYEFEVPWEVDETKSKQVGQMQLVAFRSGNALLVSRIAPKEFVNAFLSSEKSDTAGLKALYGEDVLKSDYLLMERVLEATPDKVGLLTPRSEAVGSAMLVLIKGIMMPLGGNPGFIEFGREISGDSSLVTHEGAPGPSTWKFIMKTAGSASSSLNGRMVQRRQSLRPRSTELSSLCASQQVTARQRPSS